METVQGELLTSLRSVDTFLPVVLESSQLQPSQVREYPSHHLGLLPGGGNGPRVPVEDCGFFFPWILTTNGLMAGKKSTKTN